MKMERFGNFTAPLLAIASPASESKKKTFPAGKMQIALLL
jgi:hypothetical protein